MPKFTLYRSQSPNNTKKLVKSVLKPVDVVRNTGFSLGLPQTAIVYPRYANGRYRIRTVLAARIERKVMRSAANTPDIESIWPKHSIPSKDNAYHARLLKHGIKVKKIGGIPNKNIIQPIQILTEEIKNPVILPHKSLETSELNELHKIISNNKRNNASMDEQNNFKDKKELPVVWAPIKKSNSPDIRRANTAVGNKKKRPDKKIEKVSVKEAMRDREWVAKARGQLIKDLHFHLNWSNSLTIQVPKESNITYKYYLGIGNNSKLVKQLMSSRWWWVRVPEEEMESANLVWTQWKEWNYINTLPLLLGNESETEPTNQVSINSKTKYVPVSVLNLLSIPKLVDVSPLGYDLITKSESFTHLVINQTYVPGELKTHNKLEHNYHLSNKKALFYNLVRYYDSLGMDPFSYIPMTFHIKTGENDPSFLKFEECFWEYDKRVDENGKKIANLWIIKPGENTNRGNGITVASDILQVKSELKNNPCPSTGQHTFILQKYLEKPFLINKRKFDIRCYAMITSINGTLQGYFYQEGYLRTSSRIFSLNSNNKYVHLTNDAVQKKSEDYGKFENANKMSYSDFQRYLDNHHPQKPNFLNEVLPQIRKIVKDTIQAVFLKIDTNKRAHCFEIFGYDFLLDYSLKPWLLEVNTNPCLELSSPHLARIIPAMLDNSFRIVLDSLFPEPQNSKKACTDCLPENKYELIFHSYIDGKILIDELNKFDKLKSFNEVDKNLLEMVNEESEEHPDSEEIL